VRTSHFRRARLERRHAAREATIRPGVIEGPDIGDRDELAAALAQLPVRQRTAIVLHYYEDLTERQVADAMGCSSSAAGSLISRGVETLRGRLGNGAGR
jgi:DNA-directed RNA polymerase specialized sigma24 family protein